MCIRDRSGTVYSAGSGRVVASLSATPNPFNPVTQIEFGLTVAGHVRLEVYDTRGRRVATILNEMRRAGDHAVTWQPVGLSSGVYYARMVHPDGVQTQRLLLLK